jgi:hypothetical protein
MKDRSYINKIKIICESDIRSGNRLKIDALMIRSIKKEDYETCEGIKKAIDNSKLVTDRNI